MKKLLVALLLFASIASAQDTRRFTGGLIPGPDSPTPTPTPTPECKYVPSPWGTVCDARPCSLTLMPMHLGVPKPVPIMLMTNATDREVWKDVSGQGPLKLEVDWNGNLRWIEWYSSPVDVPLKACYCDERRNVVVVCVLGKFSEEIE